MGKVLNFEEKRIEQNKLLKEADILTEDLLNFLPQERISKSLIYYQCLEYLYRKDFSEDWKTNIDCYLGVPDHIEKFNLISKIKYKIFPLLLIYNIGVISKVKFNFSLLREENSESMTIGDTGHLMHFNNHDFVDYVIEFEKKIKKKKIIAYRHFFNDEDGFYMEDKNLEQKLKDEELEYSYYYKESLLNEFQLEQYKDIEANIFKTALKLYLYLCAGRHYSVLDNYSEEEIEEISATYEKWDLKDFYEYLKDFEDPHIDYLCHSIDRYLNIFYDYYVNLYYLLKTLPGNISIEEDIEMIEQLVSNTDKEFFSKKLKHGFKKPKI